MKNWIYAALAALFATGCAPHGGYTLTGEVPEAWEGKPVVLFTTDAGQAEAIDSTTVANGKFRLQGVLLLVDPTLGEYAMLSEAVKVLGKLNENIETMLKKQKKGEKHENT